MNTSEEPQQVAAAVAKKWLSLVDSGDYAESWNQASSLLKTGFQSSSLFRAGVSEQQWQSSLAPLRSELGRAVSRILQSARYAKELPGEPDGEFVTLEYATSFESKHATETVVLVKESDDRWRVSGYRVMLGVSIIRTFAPA